MEKFIQPLAIILMCVVAAVSYGIVHDQITARVCVEYFTVGHPPILGTDDPTLLGIGWGILATWWVGLPLGVALAIAARAGPRPRRSVGSLVRPIVGLLLVMAAAALLAGIAGWFFARGGIVRLVGPIARELPADRHVPFLADLWAHAASYFVGVTGGVVVLVQANGRTITGTWSKASISAPTLLFDATGAPVQLTAGQTFVQVIALSYAYELEAGRLTGDGLGAR